MGRVLQVNASVVYCSLCCSPCSVPALSRQKVFGVVDFITHNSNIFINKYVKRTVYCLRGFLI
jgi:hypothetical protein